MKYTIPFFSGFVGLKSKLSIEQVGDILSKKIFCGLEFIGKDESIYEEVPAIFIESYPFGLRVILQGYEGLGENEGYCLEVQQKKTFRDKENVKRIEYHLDDYLYLLLDDALKDNKDIILLYPEPRDI